MPFESVSDEVSGERVCRRAGQRLEPRLSLEGLQPLVITRRQASEAFGAPGFLDGANHLGAGLDRNLAGNELASSHNHGGHVLFGAWLA